MGRKIVRVMPVTRNDLTRPFHNSWMNTTVPYLHNLYNSLRRRVSVVIRGAGLPHKMLINKVFSQNGQYMNMSHFSRQKYSFAVNYRDEKASSIFDVKQRLIWHFPKASRFLSGECVCVCMCVCVCVSTVTWQRCHRYVYLLWGDYTK